MNNQESDSSPALTAALVVVICIVFGIGVVLGYLFFQ